MKNPNPVREFLETVNVFEGWTGYISLSSSSRSHQINLTSRDLMSLHAALITGNLAVGLSPTVKHLLYLLKDASEKASLKAIGDLKKLLKEEKN